MAPMCHNFSVLTFTTHLILCIRVWLICVGMWNICSGVTKSCNFNSGSIALSKKKRILAIIMFLTLKNSPGYKEHVIYFIVFAFGEGVTVIDWM